MFDKYDTDKALSKRFFQETYQKLCEEYYGNGVELLDETKYEYSHIPHFFREFYVYKYATGMLSAILIVKKFMDKRSRPAMAESSVDLPQPEGPRMLMNWPFSTVRLMSFRARVSPVF